MNGRLQTRRDHKRHESEHSTYVLSYRPEPDPRFSPLHVDYRTELNNWLQVNSGPERLGWASFRPGPENNPIWTAMCLSVSIVSHLSSF